MSDLRVALIAEGPTDRIIIESALRAILPAPFVLTQLQPEPTRPDLGGGWGGVLKWSREFYSRGAASLEDDPTLQLYDLFIIHIDADVTDFSYSDLKGGVEEKAREEGWGVLPCPHQCPPAAGAVNNLKQVLFSWLGLTTIGGKTVLCIPSKSSEAWLAAAVYPGNENLVRDLECCMTMEARLAALPKKERIKKSVKQYRDHEAAMKAGWPTVRAMCTRAEVFHHEMTEAIQRLVE